MCRRDCSTATFWRRLITSGLTSLNTPPTPAFASASLTWPSDRSWSCCSFSSIVIFESSVLTRVSMPWLAALRLGASAASSLDCVAATTPPATAVLTTTVASPARALPLRVLIGSPPYRQARGTPPDADRIA